MATDRSVRERLRSIFRSYFGQAFDPVDEETLVTHVPRARHAIVSKRADVHHYLRSDGGIDGTAWFREFGRSTGGITFLLADVFGSPRVLRRALDRGVVAVATAGLDAYGRDTFGTPTVRESVTRTTDHEPQVAAALTEAGETLDAGGLSLGG